ncbi:hypothetical protein DIT71_03875 [Marinobacter vulgaris]|uniref:LysR substrate-binding domain-containing protein n=1 Tax=Marinobacter vulgaris TaxID=1928331 RepID=A0A2V3ZMZ8_9GAMM|nr:hypothetical protein DIT71_03875 [Marinobacter vulgaris]TSJ71710.1 hypothetical protein FPC41_05595 [Marinobacter vulgaris]
MIFCIGELCYSIPVIERCVRHPFLSGQSFTTLPRLAFPVDNQKLCFVPLSEPKLVLQIGIIKPANRSLSPSAQALERVILKRLSGVVGLSA